MTKKFKLRHYPHAYNACIMLLNERLDKIVADQAETGVMRYGGGRPAVDPTPPAFPRLRGEIPRKIAAGRGPSRLIGETTAGPPGHRIDGMEASRVADAKSYGRQSWSVWTKNMNL
jgi:hypothetical protein